MDVVFVLSLEARAGFGRGVRRVIAGGLGAGKFVSANAMEKGKACIEGLV